VTFDPSGILGFPPAAQDVPYEVWLTVCLCESLSGDYMTPQGGGKGKQEI